MGDVPLIGALYGVGRYDHFDLSTDDDIDGWLVGFAWRPIPNVVFKLDYQFTDHETETLVRGAIAAVAISF
jgi:hypothetical protein